MLKVDRLGVTRGGRAVLDEVSLALAPGRTLAVLGGSGAGKSTLVAAILGLVPSTGRVTWAGRPVREIRPTLVMQEPRAAFNPALSLRRSVLEPLRGAVVSDERLRRLCAALDLAPALLDRRLGAVSIGQAQRIGVLRALIAAPSLVLFDEPLSALDATVRKRTAALIAALQAQEGFAAVIVTHDLGYASAHADEVAILHGGTIAESGPALEVLHAPRSAPGRALRDAAVSLGALETA